MYGHGQLSQWKKANDEGYFMEQGIYYYPDFGKDKIPMLLNMEFDKIIMDFGDAYLSYREEIMRCDRKIFLLSLNPWQNFAAKYLVRTVKNEEWGGIQPVFGAVAASEGIKREVEREYQIHIRHVPVLPEPCCIPGSAFADLGALLSSASVQKEKKLRIPIIRKL